MEFSTSKNAIQIKSLFFWLCKSISVQDKIVGSTVGADSDRDTIAGFIAGILQKYSNNKGEEEEKEVSGSLSGFFRGSLINNITQSFVSSRKY